MRVVKLTKEDVELHYKEFEGVSSFTGTDKDSGERVTFTLTDGDLINELLRRVQMPQGEVTLPLADFQIALVEAVRGEWDSPGTSPEYYDDEEF
jgi:hypothetical protein